MVKSVKSWHPYLQGNNLPACSSVVILIVHMCLFCCLSFTATCEMCGMVGVRDAFYSKTKRFCSVSCSRSYSSNSKKASILARLQVNTLKPTTNAKTLNLRDITDIDTCFGLSGQTTDKKGKSLTETASHGEVGSLCPVPSKSTEPGQIKSWYVLKNQKWWLLGGVLLCMCVCVCIWICIYWVSCLCQWSLQRASTGVGISVAVTRLELP